MVLIVVLSQNNCHFVNLPSFASSSFFLSLRKIKWLNSQQPKTRKHVEHLAGSAKFKMELNLDQSNLMP